MESYNSLVAGKANLVQGDPGRRGIHPVVVYHAPIPRVCSVTLPQGYGTTLQLWCWSWAAFNPSQPLSGVPPFFRKVGSFTNYCFNSPPWGSSDPSLLWGGTASSATLAFLPTPQWSGQTRHIMIHSVIPAHSGISINMQFLIPTQGYVYRF